MEIRVKVLSAQQNWDVITGETSNSLVLEYAGWQFSAPATEAEMAAVLTAMRVDAARESIRGPRQAPVPERVEVLPPVVFSQAAAVPARDERLAAMREKARAPQQPPTEVADTDEDGFQQG